ncbi:group 1 glycosyl transferase [Niastella koreensis]|uniref:Glycosyl transferase group 1 n=2 Tax=Niastella koreensis TaxID=354356 RepID=G8TRZ0_NIAKG|nr:glycosyltransferase family 4 protein [Niastella koreensis]AEW03325.1 glycosyl transferase group 1 [Niastella koreensis GR20-10]OQP55610.1 group 1 glycosyl transferase [Niastella koreensis]
MTPNQKTRILFFIGSLKVGGKERRLVELLTYLQARPGYELLVILTNPIIQYQSFLKLNINYQVIAKTWKKMDVSILYKFYKKCKQFKPHIIHTWGRMQTLHALPAVIGQRIPLVNGQITSAPHNAARWSMNRLVDLTNFYFSRIIIANSHAGMKSFRPPGKKTKVIYNGLNLQRFENLDSPESMKVKYGIKTPFAVVMVATFSNKKDYPLFFSIAQQITRIRNDISFVAVGDNSTDMSEFEQYRELANRNSRVVLTGRIRDVEALVNCCTIGVLFSDKINGEGISNSIIEYMGLAKPVIANDAGGTKEVVHHEENGYLIARHTENEIVKLIIDLIDNPEKISAFGKASRKIIEESFTLDRMGKAYVQTYREVITVDELKKRIPQSILLP